MQKRPISSWMKDIVSVSLFIFLLCLVNSSIFEHALKHVLTPPILRVFPWVFVLLGLGVCLWIGRISAKARQAGDRENANYALAGLIAFSMAPITGVDLLLKSSVLPANLPPIRTSLENLFDVIGLICCGVFFAVGIGIIVIGRKRLVRDWKQSRQRHHP